MASNTATNGSITATRLIIAIDVGTTFSGASYCIIQPGETPQVHDVGRYPHQHGGGHKVPSVVLFSKDGTECLGVGSEVYAPHIRAAIEADEACEARWWKLALVADVNSVDQDELIKEHIRLPPSRSAEDCFRLFLQWIMKCAEDYIASHHRNGAELISQTRPNRLLVLSHPNGTEGAAQVAMRRACVEAGIVNATRARQLVRFVTEAEASLTFALTAHTMSDWTQQGSTILICDAGGGTVDISAYTIDSISPLLSVREAAIPQCLVAGATTIDQLAAKMIAKRLQGSRWNNADDIANFSKELARSVKDTFTNIDSNIILRVGSASETDASIGLNKGLLIFEGRDLAQLYEPSIVATADALNKVFASCNYRGARKRVAMVGGFAESSFFRQELAIALGPDVACVKPDSATSKAVSHGAVAWALGGAVCERKAKMHFGVRCSVPYDPLRHAEHGQPERVSTRFVGADGRARLPHAFQCLLAKDASQRVSDQTRATFSLTKAPNELLEGTFDLLCYRGDRPPAFIDEGTGFETLARLDVDLSRLRLAVPLQTNGERQFRCVQFVIMLSLSQVELEAKWEFMQQGIAHTGEVKTVFLDDLELFSRKPAITLASRQGIEAFAGPRFVSMQPPSRHSSAASPGANSVALPPPVDEPASTAAPAYTLAEEEPTLGESLDLMELHAELSASSSRSSYDSSRAFINKATSAEPAQRQGNVQRQNSYGPPLLRAMQRANASGTAPNVLNSCDQATPPSLYHVDQDRCEILRLDDSEVEFGTRVGSSQVSALKHGVVLQSKGKEAAHHIAEQSSSSGHGKSPSGKSSSSCGPSTSAEVEKPWPTASAEKGGIALRTEAPPLPCKGGLPGAYCTANSSRGEGPSSRPAYSFADNKTAIRREQPWNSNSSSSVASSSGGGLSSSLRAAGPSLPESSISSILAPVRIPVSPRTFLNPAPSIRLSGGGPRPPRSGESVRISQAPGPASQSEIVTLSGPPNISTTHGQNHAPPSAERSPADDAPPPPPYSYSDEPEV